MNNATTMNAANLMILNKRCELYVSSDRCFAPVAHVPSSKLAEAVDAYAAPVVQVEFHTTSNPDDVAADIKKYSRRLDGIAWNRSEWSPKVVRGIVIDTVYTCTLTRG